MVVFLLHIRSDLQLHCLEYNHFQYSNKPSYTHSHFPHCALNYALKGQPPSAGGTALGNDTHTTKLAPTGQKHFIDFGCYRWGESHSPCIDWNKPPKGVILSNFIRKFAILCFVSIENLFVFLWQH